MHQAKHQARQIRQNHFHNSTTQDLATVILFTQNTDTIQLAANYLLNNHLLHKI